MRKGMKGNNNSNSISHIYDHSDCHSNKANVNNSNKFDNTFNDGTIDLDNDEASDDIFNSVNNNNNNNNFNSNNINNNNNNNNVLTSNESSERRYNNIRIGTNPIITIGLKINDATNDDANNSGGNSSPNINCFYDIPDGSQHAKVQMNMEVICIVIDSTMYNGDGMRKCSHYNNYTTINNKNINNISTTPKCSKVGVEVKVITAVIIDHISFLFKTTLSRKNEGVWVNTVLQFIATTTSNISCEPQFEWSKNTTKIPTARNISKIGVRVKAVIDFIAIKDCLSLFQRRNNSSINKIDHLNNSNNHISILIFADINTFPGSDTGDNNSHIDYNDEMTKANNNNEHKMKATTTMSTVTMIIMTSLMSMIIMNIVCLILPFT